MENVNLTVFLESTTTKILRNLSLIVENVSTSSSLFYDIDIYSSKEPTNFWREAW